MTIWSIRWPTHGTTRRPDGASEGVGCCAARDSTGAAASAVARSRGEMRTSALLAHAPLQLGEQPVRLGLARRARASAAERVDLLRDVGPAVEHLVQLGLFARQGQRA